MTIDEFIAAIGDKSPPAPEASVASLEFDLDHPLPDGYRYFLTNCNGGHVGGRLKFRGEHPTRGTIEVSVNVIGGFREGCSLLWAQDCYSRRIPDALLWIHDDPGGNAVCLGVAPPYRGRVYFWDHENEPDDGWDGSVETAGTLTLLANSFTEYVAGIRPMEQFA